MTTPKTLCFLFLTTAAALTAMTGCSSQSVGRAEEAALGKVQSAQTLRECRDECSNNSVKCHDRCGQDHSSEVDIACHRACTKTFNECYLDTCPVLADPESSTINPDEGGDKPPSVEGEPAPDTVSSPIDPGLPKEFYDLVLTDATSDGSTEKPKSEQMADCYNSCIKSSSGNWCLAYCDCKVYQGNDSLKCEAENPYIDMGPGQP